MPVEIRELIIKTEVKSIELAHDHGISQEDLLELKSDVLKLCKRMILDQTKKSNFKR